MSRRQGVASQGREEDRNSFASWYSFHPRKQAAGEACQAWNTRLELRIGFFYRRDKSNHYTEGWLGNRRF